MRWKSHLGLIYKRKNFLSNLSSSTLPTLTLIRAVPRLDNVRHCEICFACVLSLSPDPGHAAQHIGGDKKWHPGTQTPIISHSALAAETRTDIVWTQTNHFSALPLNWAARHPHSTMSMATCLLTSSSSFPLCLKVCFCYNPKTLFAKPRFSAAFYLLINSKVAPWANEMQILLLHWIWKAGISIMCVF